MTLIFDIAALLAWAALVFLALLMLGYVYLIALRLFMVKEPGKPADLSDYPPVLVQIPVFNEPNVVEGALEAAAAFDWPRDKLHIQLLDDSTDETPQHAARIVTSLQARGFDVTHLCRTDRTGYKAGALEAGLAKSYAPFAAVLDADFRAPPDWLKRAMTALVAHPHAAFVQTRNEFESAETSWLTGSQQLMQDAHYAVEQPARAWRGLPFQFNGTGGIWRQEAVVDAGGWSHDTLAEDLDLAIRCFLKGWQGVYLIDPVPVGEIPHDSAAFAVQQQRWSKGIVQVGRKHGLGLWASSLSLEAKAVTSLLFVAHFMFPAFLIAVAGFVVSSLNGLNLPMAGMFGVLTLLALAIVVGMTLPAYLILKRGTLAHYWKTLFLVPVTGIYMAFATSADVIKASAGAKGEFIRTPKSGLD